MTNNPEQSHHCRGTYKSSYLHSALDDVQRGDDEVGDAASQEATEPAEGVELVAAQLTRVAVGKRS